MEEERAGDAEDGGVRADADGERKNYDTREAGIFQERAKGVAKILEKRVHGEENGNTVKGIGKSAENSAGAS